MQAADSYTRAQITLSPRPNTLIGLMEIYERNYMLLKRLFADDDPGAARAVHHFDERHRLESVLLQRERYTTVLLLSYSLLDGRRLLAQPVQLKIRVYRDARQAELLHLVPRFSKTPFTGEETLRDKWLLNKFLHRLLTRFSRCGAQLVRYGDTSQGADQQSNQHSNQQGKTGEIPGGASDESKNQP